MPTENENPEDNGHSNGWLMYQRLVLAELERHDQEINGECGLKNSVANLRTEFEVLQAKIFAYGAIAGGCAAIVAEIIIRSILATHGVK